MACLLPCGAVLRGSLEGSQSGLAPAPGVMAPPGPAPGSQLVPKPQPEEFVPEAPQGMPMGIMGGALDGVSSVLNRNNFGPMHPMEPKNIEIYPDGMSRVGPGTVRKIADVDCLMKKVKQIGYDCPPQQLVGYAPGPAPAPTASPGPGPAASRMRRPGEYIFSRYAGWIGSGADIHVDTMVPHQALKRCIIMPGCMGVTFEGTPSQVPVPVHFKSEWNIQGSGWTSFKLESGRGEDKDRLSFKDKLSNNFVTQDNARDQDADDESSHYLDEEVVYADQVGVLPH